MALSCILQFLKKFFLCPIQFGISQVLIHCLYQSVHVLISPLSCFQIRQSFTFLKFSHIFNITNSFSELNKRTWIFRFCLVIMPVAVYLPKRIYEVLTFLEGVATSAILTSTCRMRPAVCKNETLFYKTSHKPIVFLMLSL